MFIFSFRKCRFASVLLILPTQRKKRTKTSEALPKGCFLEKKKTFALHWAVIRKVLGNGSGSV